MAKRLTTGKAPQRRVHIYTDRRREWRWTLFATNGKKVACSGEGYRRRGDCVAMARALFPVAVVSAVGRAERVR